MEKRGRKTERNKKAGKRLGKAIQILTNFLHITIEDLCNMPDWKNNRSEGGCSLPYTTKTINDWLIQGIPVEQSKVQRVAEFLRVTVDTFLSESEHFFEKKLKESWGINDDNDNDFHKEIFGDDITSHSLILNLKKLILHGGLQKPKFIIFL